MTEKKSLEEHLEYITKLGKELCNIQPNGDSIKDIILITQDLEEIAGCVYQTHFKKPEISLESTPQGKDFSKILEDYSLIHIKGLTIFGDTGPSLNWGCPVCSEIKHYKTQV